MCGYHHIQTKEEENTLTQEGLTKDDIHWLRKGAYFGFVKEPGEERTSFFTVRSGGGQTISIPCLTRVKDFSQKGREDKPYLREYSCKVYLLAKIDVLPLLSLLRVGDQIIFEWIRDNSSAIISRAGLQVNELKAIIRRKKEENLHLILHNEIVQQDSLYHMIRIKEAPNGRLEQSQNKEDG